MNRENSISTLTGLSGSISIDVLTEFRAIVTQDIELDIKPTGNITGSVTHG